jgi:hypothetical protein
MPKVAVYTRATTGGSRRRYVKATRGSTGPFFLRYEINGKRVWEGLGTRTYTFALADARSKASSLLREEATPPKPLPVASKSLEELRTAFIHDKKTTFKKDGTPLDPDTGAAISPLFVGFMFARPSWINLPFFITGTFKILYDLLLYREFVAIEPPEEQ